MVPIIISPETTPTPSPIINGFRVSSSGCFSLVEATDTDWLVVGFSSIAFICGVVFIDEYVLFEMEAFVGATDVVISFGYVVVVVPVVVVVCLVDVNGKAVVVGGVVFVSVDGWLDDTTTVVVDIVGDVVDIVGDVIGLDVGGDVVRTVVAFVVIGRRVVVTVVDTFGVCFAVVVATVVVAGGLVDTTNEVV